MGHRRRAEPQHARCGQRPNGLATPRVGGDDRPEQQSPPVQLSHLVGDQPGPDVHRAIEGLGDPLADAARSELERRRLGERSLPPARRCADRSRPPAGTPPLPPLPPRARPERPPSGMSWRRSCRGSRALPDRPRRHRSRRRQRERCGQGRRPTRPTSRTRVPNRGARRTRRRCRAGSTRSRQGRADKRTGSGRDPAVVDRPRKRRTRRARFAAVNVGSSIHGRRSIVQPSVTSGGPSSGRPASRTAARGLSRARFGPSAYQTVVVRRVPRGPARSCDRHRTANLPAPVVHLEAYGGRPQTATAGRRHRGGDQHDGSHAATHPQRPVGPQAPLRVDRPRRDPRRRVHVGNDDPHRHHGAHVRRRARHQQRRRRRHRPARVGDRRRHGRGPGARRRGDARRRARGRRGRRRGRLDPGLRPARARRR